MPEALGVIVRTELGKGRLRKRLVKPLALVRGPANVAAEMEYPSGGGRLAKGSEQHCLKL
jgi:hypothetical protein